MNDLSEAPRLYARKGEHVACVQGHVICTIARDVVVGERSMDIFTDWRQPEPDKATTLNRIRCTLCKGVWIRKSGRVPQLHFAEGWR